MQTIIDTFDEIARRAPGAHRDVVDALTAQVGVLDAALKTTIALGTIKDADLAAAADAHARAVAATDAAFGDTLKRQYGLISRLDEDRRERWNMTPMSAPALLLLFMSSGSAEITSIVRDHGTSVTAKVNGVALGDVHAHSIRVRDDHLVVGGLERWPLARIEAASTQDGLAILLDDGTMIEMEAGL